MVSKFGKKIEDVSKLFGHAAHNGSKYLNGHCFVSLILCVPVWKAGRIVYLSVPLRYRIWQKKGSKSELSASMGTSDNARFCFTKNVIILCYSWYAKKNLVCVVDEYPNLELICNKIGDYYIGVRQVLTNIFGHREVLAYVTSAEKESNSRRLFFSTIFSEHMQIFCA